MDTLVEASLDWSALVIDDLAQLAELCAAIDYFDDPVERLTLADLTDSFTAPGANPGRNAVVGRDRGGTIVAYGWNHVRGAEEGRPRVWLGGGIHPAWRHQQIGTRLVGWQLDRAREWLDELVANPVVVLHEPLWVGVHVDARQPAQMQLMGDCGLRPERWYTDLHRLFSDANGAPTGLPPMPALGNFQVVPYHPSMAEQVRRAHNETFSSRRGFHPVEPAAWLESLARPAARPQWSWVAMDGSEVVGYALNSSTATEDDEQGWAEGWTDRLGVRPLWRRNRIGQALLVASMRSFLDAGLVGAGLGLDTEDPEGTLALYERLGYEAEETVVLYSCQLEPGG